VSLLYKRLAVLQNFYAIILLLANEGVEKRFGETVYKKDKEEKKQRRENSVCD